MNEPRRMSAVPGPGLTVSGLGIAVPGPGPAVPGPGLAVSGLGIADRAGRVVLAGQDLAVPEGSVLALMGPSGGGKTSLVLGALDALEEGLQRTSGRVAWEGREIAPGREARRWRRTRLGFLSQDPASDLHPLHTVRRLVGSGLRGPARGSADPGDRRLRGGRRQGGGRLRRDRAERDHRVLGMLRRLGLGAEHLNRRAHELSGGQARRVAIACAFLGEPSLLVLDEPTSGLDAGALDLVVELLAGRRGAPGRATIVITHDRSFAERVSDAVVEIGPVAAPVGPLIAPAAAAVRPAASPPTSPPALAARGLCVRAGREGPVLLDDVDLTVRPGEMVALVGPSGSGKSTLLRQLAGLVPAAVGEVRLDGEEVAARVEERGRQALRRLQLVAQDPAGALHPAHRVRTDLIRPARLLLGESGPAARARAAGLMAEVGLSTDLLDRTPAGLSGGQRQRVALARALACAPSVLLADEATSALDAATARRVLDLLDALRRRRGLAVLLTTHDPEVAARADVVLGIDPSGRRLTPRSSHHIPH